MPKSLSDIAADLADIDNRVESIAIKNPEGSEISILAYAIHNLVLSVEDVVEHLR